MWLIWVYSFCVCVYFSTCVFVCTLKPHCVTDATGVETYVKACLASFSMNFLGRTYPSSWLWVNVLDFSLSLRAQKILLDVKKVRSDRDLLI